MFSTRIVKSTQSWSIEFTTADILRVVSSIQVVNGSGVDELRKFDPTPTTQSVGFVHFSSEVSTFDSSASGGHDVEKITEKLRLTTTNEVPEETPSLGQILRSQGLAWDIHVNCFAAVFVVLGVLSLLHFLYVTCFGRKKVKSAPYHAGLALCIAIMSFCKAFYLLYDPYFVHGELHLVANNILTNIAQPCLSSAFHLLAQALLRMTKLKLLGKNVVSPLLVACVIFVNFTFAITTDAIVAFYPRYSYIMIICLAYFVTWGVVYFILYTVILIILYRAIRKNIQTLAKLVNNSMELENKGIATKSETPADNNHLRVPGDSPQRARAQKRTQRLSGRISGPRKMPVAINLTSIIALLFLLYSAVSILVLLSITLISPSAWQLLQIQTVWRIVEVLLAGMILLVSGLPSYR